MSLQDFLYFKDNELFKIGNKRRNYIFPNKVTEDKFNHHPFVIYELCQELGVPLTGTIYKKYDSFIRKYFSKSNVLSK